MDKQTEHPVPGENNNLDNLTPDKLMEQKNLNKRLVATACSLKKQKRKLKTVEDALRIRWSKVISTADKYGDSRRAKSYPKRKLLPEFDEEALEPSHSKNEKATRSDRRPHKAASGAAPKSACDPLKDSHHGPVRSIYGPRKQALVSNAMKPSSESAHPNTRAQHTPYVSSMRWWIRNFQRDSNP